MGGWSFIIITYLDSAQRLLSNSPWFLWSMVQLANINHQMTQYLKPNQNANKLNITWAKNSKLQTINNLYSLLRAKSFYSSLSLNNKEF
jgi:hypothetical protein